MFEEICLVCGKHLDDDGRAYCSDDCQQTDLSSPSISSSSSALSSPNMPPSQGPDVPALMPNALGSALRVYAARTRGGPYSSASSASWSVLTDEEDEYRYNSSDYAVYPYPDAADDAKSANFLYAPPRLSYARRPSETNTHSTVPHLGHRRLSSGGSSSSGRGVPRSAPLRSAHDLEDDAYSDFSYLPPEQDTDDADIRSEKAWSASAKYPGAASASAAAKAKRARNRGSLPAYFSLLQMGPTKRASPASSSASNATTARPSPPTPKVPAHAPVIPSAPSQAYTTPRGRRRETDASSRSSRRSGRSSTRSRSRSRRAHMNLVGSYLTSPHFTSNAPEEEDEIDWTTAPLRRRGREPVRRHSSPPPRVVMGVSVDPIADAARDLSMGRWTMQQMEWEERERGRERGRSGSGYGVRSGSGRGREEHREREREKERERERGRMRIEGAGTSSEAPGFGTGRSGLVARDRGAGAGGHLVRVPV